MKKTASIPRKTNETNSIGQASKRKELPLWIAPGAISLFILFMTIGQNSTILWKLQDLDLFLYNDQFLLDNLQRVGGLSMYIGSFLTQFFYYPPVGAFLFLSLLLLVGFLTYKAFDLKSWHSPLAFIPSLALLLCLTQQGYMIYFNKVDGYVYNNVIGVLVFLTGFLAYKHIGKVRYKILFSIGFVLVGYPICGVFALFGGFVMLLSSLKSYLETRQSPFVILALLILATILFTPLFYYRFLFENIAFGDIYSANLPYFTFKGDERILWLPFLSMAFFYCCVLWLNPTKGSSSKPLWNRALPISLFVASTILVYVFSFNDANFKTEIAMLNAIDREEWNDVLKVARRQKEEPTRLLVMSTNLALYKLGMAGDRMFQYPNGDKPMRSPRLIVPIHIAGPSFYYQYGLPNYCTKWCMEGVVEYGLNVTGLKYFVLSSLLNGDIALAQKYNDVLRSTLFYQTWALKYQKFIDHPETIATATEFANILPLTEFNDELNGDYYHLESFLRSHFSNLREVPSQLTELSVIFNLDIKDDKKFWPRLFRWVKLNPNQRIPIHFQEAALMFADITKMDISGAPFDSNVIANFKNFQAMVQQYNGYPEASLKEMFYAPFGKTYWYYYFLVKSHVLEEVKSNGYKN